MIVADARVAENLARLECLAELLAAYSEAEVECWTCLGHLSAALTEHLEEMRRRLAQT